MRSWIIAGVLLAASSSLALAQSVTCQPDLLQSGDVAGHFHCPGAQFQSPNGGWFGWHQSDASAAANAILVAKVLHMGTVTFDAGEKADVPCNVSVCPNGHATSAQNLVIGGE